MQRVIVCCPGDAITGGPELLHQFVSALRVKNVDARVLYFPFSGDYKTQEVYAKYNVCTIRYDEVKADDVVVLPEVSTNLLSFFKFNKVFLWWLSVDNYFGSQNINGIKCKVRHLFDILKGNKISLNEIKRRNIFHLVQSKYAHDFLSRNGIESLILTDYLNEEHLEQKIDNKIKLKQVAYNPKKGFKYTRRLIEMNRDIRFVPIQNMTPPEVKSLLQKSMLYIDFGNHPGKDRFPREAAMAGCCIITGTEGSALNDTDVCIPKEYKINAKSKCFTSDFGELVAKIFSNFEQFSTDFDYYRSIISNEKNEFDRQVNEFVSRFLAYNH